MVSSRASSLSGSTLPLPVTSGVCISEATSSPLPPRRMIGRRVSPSKCSPSHTPSPSALIAVPSSGRVQPASARRRSSGCTRSSGEMASGLGKDCTFAPGNCVFSRSRPARAACSSCLASLACRWIWIARAEPPKPPNSSPSKANARVSGKPRITSSRTTCSSSPMRASSTTRAPIVPPPGHSSKYQFFSCGVLSPSMYGFMRSRICGVISAFTRVGLMPGGKSKNASMAARLTGGR